MITTVASGCAPLSMRGSGSYPEDLSNPTSGASAKIAAASMLPAGAGRWRQEETIDVGGYVI